MLDAGQLYAWSHWSLRINGTVAASRIHPIKQSANLDLACIKSFWWYGLTKTQGPRLPRIGQTYCKSFLQESLEGAVTVKPNKTLAAANGSGKEAARSPGRSSAESMVVHRNLQVTEGKTQQELVWSNCQC